MSNQAQTGFGSIALDLGVKTVNQNFAPGQVDTSRARPVVSPIPGFRRSRPYPALLYPQFRRYVPPSPVTRTYPLQRSETVFIHGNQTKLPANLSEGPLWK